MAELGADSDSACCASDAQASCCEPSEKATCCGAPASGATCGCCIAGALTEEDFRAALAAVGLVEVDIHETHRVHEHVAAAVIRARKPAA